MGKDGQNVSIFHQVFRAAPFYFGSIQGAPGSRTKRMHIYRENDFKESAHTITDTGKFESVGWAGRLSPRRD